jgi:large subunit ribosomal protein L32e
LSEIEGLNVETQAIRVAHTVGQRKRMEILAKAREKGLHILNPHELKETKEELEETAEAEKGKEEAEVGEAEVEGGKTVEEKTTDEETR